MSRRTDRIGSLIRTLVAEAIRTRLSDPRIAPITSVTGVRVSEDLSVARVAVSVMGSETERQECLRALRSATGRIRGLVGEELTLRKVPMLVFRLDDSIRRSFEIVQTIDRAMQELGVRPEWEREDATDEAAADGAGNKDERPAEGGGAQEDA